MNKVRFSSENWSGTSFIIAFALFFTVKKHNVLSCIYIGLLLGFSFIIRYQSGFLIAGFLAWIIIIKKEKLINIFAITIAIILVVFLGILSDRWFYGEWTITAWNYFDVNILQDIISGFGIKPWYYYPLTFFIQGIPPFSLLFIFSLIIFLIFKRTSPVTWSILPFLVIHFIIGHKEMRFLFPIAGFLPVIAIEAIETVQMRYLKDLPEKRYLQLFMKGFFIVNYIFLIIISFRPADQQVCLYRKIYNRYKDSVTLFYVDQNPYKRGLDINFYKRKNLEIRQISSKDSIQDIPGRTELIVYSNYNEQAESKGKDKLIYSSFPEWIVRFNFNNWMSRSWVWHVYELN
jgi:phosphatidylinositol glycan class B